MLETITAEEYHAGKPDTAPALSSSIAKIMLSRSPFHAWLEHPRLNPIYKPEHNGKFDTGTAAHALLLEGEDRMAVLEYSDWRTNASKEAREEARTQGKIPVLASQYQDVQAMVNLAVKAISENVDLGYTLADGKPEQSLFWREGETECKARFDWVSNDCKLILDYKTTDISSPESWMRSIPAQGYDLQAAWYLRALQQYSEMPANFVFMVQETSAPYACYFVGMSPAYLEVGRQKVDAALRMWSECVRKGIWPDYPRRIMYPEPTAWSLVDAEEKAAISKDWTPEAFLFGHVPDKEVTK